MKCKRTSAIVVGAIAGGGSRRGFITNLFQRRDIYTKHRGEKTRA
jgi:hypothetical protein